MIVRLCKRPERKPRKPTIIAAQHASEKAAGPAEPKVPRRPELAAGAGAAWACRAAVLRRAWRLSAGGGGRAAARAPELSDEGANARFIVMKVVAASTRPKAPRPSAVAATRRAMWPALGAHGESDGAKGGKGGRAAAALAASL
mmetsp:Transcript_29553/g.81211  ORF Transcript_29553/g.81211 Transcript_29553/m.81211 type:complete len:144 (+) Transcript_29553:681-1112(+)